MIGDTPKLVHRPASAPWPMLWTSVEVADFTADKRPAYRVECHCRNCNWKGEARAPVGTKVPQWMRCPKCECYELSAHGAFLGRDELTLDEESANHEAAVAAYCEQRERDRELVPDKADAKRRRWAL